MINISAMANSFAGTAKRHSARFFNLLLAMCMGGALLAHGSVTSISLQAPALSTSSVNYVTSPVHVQAIAASPLKITGFVVYVDNLIAFRNMLPTVDAWIPLAPGTKHSIYVKAWDSSGANLSTKTYSITVTKAAPPVAPAYATHLVGIDKDSSKWTAFNGAGVGGQCNSGQILSYPSQYDPNTATAPGAFGYGQHFMVASKCQYDDGLFFWKNGAAVAPSSTNFIWDFWFYIPTSSLSNHVQALEFDLFQAVKMSNGVHEFMFGSQCNYATNQLQLWLPMSGSLHWVDAGVSPCKFTAGSWHHATYYLQRMTSSNYQMIPASFSPSTDTNSAVRFVSLTIDGNTYYLGKTAFSTMPGWSPTFGVQHQLDSSVKGITIEEYATAESIYAW